MQIRRRGFITLLGSAVAAWPLAAGAQQPATPVVGWLSIGQPSMRSWNALREGLSEQGYVDGRNVAFEIRSAEQFSELPALAAELVRRRVAVIYTGSAASAAQAAKAATATTPIVFTLGNDPIRAGLVASLNRPGGNVTGATFLAGELGPKRLELARELVPQAAMIGLLINPTNVIFEADEASIQAAARSVGQNLVVLHASTVAEIDAAFTAAVQQRIAALILNGAAYANSAGAIR